MQETEIRKPKVYMTEREMKRIFNLPKPAMKALEEWEKKHTKNEGHENHVRNITIRTTE